MLDAVHPHVFMQQARAGELLFLGTGPGKDLTGYVIINVNVSDSVSHGEATRRMAVSHMAPDGTKAVVVLINPQISEVNGVMEIEGERAGARGRTVIRAMKMGPIYICTGCAACRD